ncbi:hypothetical protein ACFW04_000801 [Cataglyphis niger]
MATVRFTKINLHYSKSASAILARSMAVVHTCITLMQEPWVYRGCIMVCGRHFSPQFMPEFCSRDVAAIVTRKVVVSSATSCMRRGGSFLPGSVVKQVEYCQAEELPLIVRKHLEYLMVTDLEILNKGNEPTFQNVLRREVLDLILCSRNLIPEIVGWQVSFEPSLSDHRQIAFRLANVKPEAIYKRNPKRTNWDSFREDLSTGGFLNRHGTGAKVEKTSVRAVRFNKRVFWWGPGLLRQGAWHAWNRSKNTVAAKKESWRRFCESMEQVPKASRLCKILLKNPVSNLQTARLPDKDITNFPGFRRRPDVDLDAWINFSGVLIRGARADQWVADADSESLSFFGIHLQGMKADESDFRPVSQTSFLLKTLEKLIEIYLRDVFLEQHPVMGFSTETALHFLISQIERDCMEGD